MNPIKGKYWAEPVPGSVYGNVLGILVDQDISSAEIVDFGCGYAPLAEPLRKMGLEYLGIDFDENAISNLNDRGFKGLKVDLREDIKKDFFNTTGRDEIKIALLLDVLEHFEPENNKLNELINSQGFDYLIISVPNVANRKVLNELAINEFRYQETGIFDQTHLTFYTRSTLEKLISKYPLVKIVENNTYESFKPLYSKAGIRDFIKFMIIKIVNVLYRMINKDSEILQFVWLLKRVES